MEQAYDRISNYTYYVRYAHTLGFDLLRNLPLRHIVFSRKQGRNTHISQNY